jgi:hypothetical protein
LETGADGCGNTTPSSLRRSLIFWGMKNSSDGKVEEFSTKEKWFLASVAGGFLIDGGLNILPRTE